MKTYLLTPGPTPLPEKVVSTFAQPIIHHRSSVFIELFQKVRENLKYVFQTKEECLVLSSSGTGGVEAVIVNLFNPGEKIITIEGGKFGERWTKVANAYGVQTVSLKPEYGDSFDPSEVTELLKKNPDVKGIVICASETSTGVVHPVKEVAQIMKAHGGLVVVDAITALGVMDLPMDAWGLDAVIGGSQKAFMLPPGMALLSLSQAAWKKVDENKQPKFYFDLKRELKAHLKDQTAFTPPVSLIQGLNTTLEMIRNEGLPNVFRRHSVCAEATRAAAKALGLELFSKRNHSTAITAVKVPSSVADGKKIPSLMKNRYGVTIVGGQDSMEGKIFRLAHIGYIYPLDIIVAITALEWALKELGHKFNLGQGVSAASEVLFRDYQDKKGS